MEGCYLQALPQKSQNGEERVSIFFWLLVGHAISDFTFQSDSMAKGKNRNRKPDMSVVPVGQVYTPCWYYWLSAHALIHGGAVALATGSVALGVCETLSHWVIDFGKCENWYGIHIDQSLHLGCKILWLAFSV